VILEVPAQPESTRTRSCTAPPPRRPTAVGRPHLLTWSAAHRPVPDGSHQPARRGTPPGV